MTDASQAVTEEKAKPEDPSKTGPEAAVGGSDAQDKTLDDLLKEGEQTFEEKSKPDDEPEKKDDTGLELRIEKLEQSRTKELVNKGISEAVKAIKESNETLGSYPEKLVRGFIFEKAEDPRFLVAFSNRETNPGAWNGILKAVGKELSELVAEIPNPELSESRQAAQAASRRVSTEPPPEEEVDVNAMSEQEFAAHQKALDRVKASG